MYSSAVLASGSARMVGVNMQLALGATTAAIGDFAEGVPFEERPHWKQYAVEPPPLVGASEHREDKRIERGLTSRG
jgi:hypothetical protein